jgi:cysteine desulfurase
VTPIYLDNNATTPPLPEVIETIARVQREAFGNPGSRHSFGRQARRILETSRESIAAILGADASEVVFTSGGTEAINLALRGLARGTSGTILLSPGEHPATKETCLALAARGWRIHELPVDGSGLLTAAGICEAPWDEIRLASSLLAHNETGVIQDLSLFGEHCRQRRVPWHVDAVQAVGRIPVDFHALGATTLSCAAHKFHGPRGIGVLLVREGCRLEPLHFGGHQEAGRRAGTEPTALAAGMAKALELWQGEQRFRTARVGELRDRLQEGLASRCGPAVVIGAGAPRLPNTLNMAFPGVDGEALLVALDLAGVACSLGGTCASGALEPAPILAAMGFADEIRKSAVRLSLSCLNTRTEIDEVIERVARVVCGLRSGGRTAS